MLSKYKGVRTALTFIEMIVAVAIIAILFAAILPQFNNISKGWDTKRAKSEMMQNARVLVDHINRNLSTAERITAVSDQSETNGYLEFESNDGSTMRYQLSEDNFVQFGPVGSEENLAGPVSELQFMCYDDNALDLAITDVESIRCINVRTTLTDVASLARPQTFECYAYMSVNGSLVDGSIVKEASCYEFDIGAGDSPALEKIDNNHCICVYSGLGNDGWAVVLTFDFETEVISKEFPFEFDTEQCSEPSLVKIDDKHYLCAYTGHSNRGWVVVLEVDTADWTISKETPFNFDSNKGQYPELAKIDDSNYICTYKGWKGRTYASLFDVNLSTWQITEQDNVELNSGNGGSSALVQIDANHFLCAYNSSGSDCEAVVVIADTVSGSISAGSNFTFSSVTSGWPDLAQIDTSNYLCAYTSQTNTGKALVLNVNTSTWNISAPGESYQFSPSRGLRPVVAEIDDSRVLCAWDGDQSRGETAILNIDTATGAITAGQEYEFDLIGQTPDIQRIDATHYISVYKGNSGTGWAVLFDVDPPPKP